MTCEEDVVSNDIVHLELEADLQAVAAGCCGSGDHPQVSIQREIKAGKWQSVYNHEPKFNELKPKFKVSARAGLLCKGNYDLQLKFII